MKIITENKNYIAVYKEAGLPVETKRFGARDLETLVMKHIASRSPGNRPYAAVINRIDQPVEGLVLFARDRKSAAALSAQLQKHEMKKTYLAVCSLEHLEDASLEQKLRSGEPVTLVDYLYHDKKNNVTLVQTQKNSKIGQNGNKLCGTGQGQSITQSISGYGNQSNNKNKSNNKNQSNNDNKSDNKNQSADFKRAELTFTCLKIQEQKALLRVNLKTGRHHQIRVQLAHAGLPICGDMKYGIEKSVNEKHGGNNSVGITTENTVGSVDQEIKFRTENSGDSADSETKKGSLALCSAELNFRDPRTNKPVHLEVKPQGEYFRKLL